jgi:PAS domain S-box-containing protein
VVDKEGNFVSANPAGLELLRCTAQDVAGIPVAETYLPEERAKYWERLKKLNAGARLRFERIFVRKDATQVPVEVSSSSMRHGYSQVVVRDISERKRAETELRRSEAYLAEAQKLSQTGSWACTAERLETTYFSTEMFRIMGLPAGENPPSTERISKYFAPEAWARIMELFEKARRKKVTCDGEFPMVLPDGSNRMIRIVGHPVLNAAGDIVEFVGTTIDITEQRQARAALEKALAEIKKSEDKLQIIIDTIPTLAWCTLPDGSAEFLNQRWLDYTGLSVEEARNWGWTVVLHVEDSTHLMDKWRASVATGEPFEAEARFRRADGTYRWCLARAVPLRDELGNIIRWYGTNTDIEDLKRAEEELHKARVELAHVTRVTTLGEMTASIAHEINQPLAAVVNNASACLRWLAAHNLEEARRSAVLIIADGHRAGEIISGIRSLVNKASPQKDWLNINETILEVIALARSEVQGNRIALQTQLSDELPLVLGDRIQLQQVILNLVMNGIEAMSAVTDRSRDLDIRSRRHESDKVLVAVKDSGTGLETESLDHLFEAFFTTKLKGMGMGLAISRSIIEAHGGRLWASPNDGPGATFQFTLPACSKQE